MPKRVLLALCLLLVGSGCLGRPASTPATAPPTGTIDPSASPVLSNPPLDTVDLRFGDRAVTAEVADDHRERVLGLMNRRDLDEDAGMLFVFPAKINGGFWMKNTLIPLQIAYMGRVDEGFEVLSIVDMVPCRKDPCPDYPPGVAFDAALEMEADWFDAAGVEVGDLVEGPDDL